MRITVVLALLTATASSLLFGWFSLLYPFGRDQGEYATLGWLWLEGATIYKDYFSVKPPGTHLVHALSQIAFGHTVQAIRIYDCISAIVISFILYVLVHWRWQRHAHAAVAVLIYSGLYYQLDYWSTAQTETFQTLPMMVGMLAILLGSSPIWTLCAGVSFGIAGLFKYPIVAICVLLPAFRRQVAVAGRFREAALLLMGALIPVSLFMLHLHWNGALADFISMTWGYYSLYNVAGEYSAILPVTLKNQALLGAAIGLSLVVLTRPLHSAKDSDFRFAALALATVVQIVIQQKYYGYHFNVLFAPLAYLLVYIHQGCLQALSTPRLRRCARMLLYAGGVLLIVVPHVGLQRKYASIIQNSNSVLEIHQNNWFSGYDDKRDYSVRGEYEVATYLQSVTSSDEQVLIWGFEPGVYFLSKRLPLPPFIYNFLLFSTFEVDLYRQRFIQNFSEQKPAVVLVVQNDSIPWVTRSLNDSHDELKLFPELLEVLSTEYQYTASIEDFEVYCRKGLECMEIPGKLAQKPA